MGTIHWVKQLKLWLRPELPLIMEFPLRLNLQPLSYLMPTKCRLVHVLISSQLPSTVPSKVCGMLSQWLGVTQTTIEYSSSTLCIAECNDSCDLILNALFEN